MDVDFFLHFEDIDFCMRIEKMGGSILYLPTISVTHKRSTSDIYPGVIEWYKARSCCKYFGKHFTKQYPNWARRVLSLAIYLRLLLRLPAITFLWLIGKFWQRWALRSITFKGRVKFRWALETVYDPNDYRA